MEKEEGCARLADGSVVVDRFALVGRRKEDHVLTSHMKEKMRRGNETE